MSAHHEPERDASPPFPWGLALVAVLWILALAAAPPLHQIGNGIVHCGTL